MEDSGRWKDEKMWHETVHSPVEIFSSFCRPLVSFAAVFRDVTQRSSFRGSVAWHPERLLRKLPKSGNWTLIDLFENKFLRLTSPSTRHYSFFKVSYFTSASLWSSVLISIPSRYGWRTSSVNSSLWTWKQKQKNCFINKFHRLDPWSVQTTREFTRW